ncbi:SpoIIE family protein phosphatase [Kitasatospora sp. NPDC088391]|uniref:SpoIIE family protein phosphatase n=1 Tax=Kitasatospora sp. NPDC088391 TaxID=3364074 RepID=UPI00381546D8
MDGRGEQRDPGETLRRTVRQLREQQRESAPADAPAPPKTSAPPEPPQDPEDDLRRLLDALPQAAVLAEPVRDRTGALRDLAVLVVNEAAARHPHHPDRVGADGGCSLREAYPGLWSEAFADLAAEVLRTGLAARAVPVRREVAASDDSGARGGREGGNRERGSQEQGDLEESVREWGDRERGDRQQSVREQDSQERDGRAQGRQEQPSRERVTAHRLGRRLLLVWADDRAEELARAAQRIARVGWVEWSVRDGRLEVSPGLAVLLGLEPDVSTVPVGRALGRITETGRPALYRALDRLLSTGEDIDLLVETYGDGRRRRIRLVGEAVREGGGPVEGLRAVLQDVTELAESRRLLRAQEAETERQARRADAEHRVVQRLQDALQPRSAALDGLGVSTAVAYRPAEAQVGGDWFKVRQLPDGQVLLAVGDARGHGLDAVALMSMLRHALAGLAFTGGLVESLGGWLNRIAYDEGDEATATAIVSRYYPDRRLLRWICAGHPPPVLLRDGRATVLTPDTGPPFGVLPDIGYGAVETRVRPGDTVLLYTDGLVERRDQDIDDRLDALRATVERLAAEDSSTGPDLQELVDAVVWEMSGPLSEDDATLLAFRFDR